MTIARALWTIAPGIAELRPETLPARAPDQVLARMLASGISRGTERLVLAGRVSGRSSAMPGAIVHKARAMVMDGPRAWRDQARHQSGYRVLYHARAR